MNHARTFNPEAMQGQADEASRLLKALANEQRLRVLCLLVDHELTVGQLNGHMPELSQSALSQHLARLRGEGMVETRRASQQIWYRLADGPAYRVLRTLHDIYCGPGPARSRKHAVAGVTRRSKRVS